MILIQFCQFINEMMAVAVDNLKNFGRSRFLIIRQNVNMATNTILNCGLTPFIRPSCIRPLIDTATTNSWEIPVVAGNSPLHITTLRITSSSSVISLTSLCVRRQRERFLFV